MKKREFLERLFLKGVTLSSLSLILFKVASSEAEASLKDFDGDLNQALYWSDRHKAKLFVPRGKYFLNKHWFKNLKSFQEENKLRSFSFEGSKVVLDQSAQLDFRPLKSS